MLYWNTVNSLLKESLLELMRADELKDLDKFHAKLKNMRFNFRCLYHL